MAIPEELGRLLLVLHNGAFIEANKATLTFQQQVETLRALGMSDESIRQAILLDFVNDNGVYFGAYRSAIREQIAGGIHQAYQLGVNETYRVEDPSGEGMYRWTTVGDEKSCDDCAQRAGEERTLEEWQTIGMPKSGFSRCGRRCRCEVTPVEAEAPARIVA